MVRLSHISGNKCLICMILVRSGLAPWLDLPKQMTRYIEDVGPVEYIV